MLPVRERLVRQPSTAAHVCLSCRLKTQRRLRHTSPNHVEDNTVGITRVGEDASAHASNPRSKLAYHSAPKSSEEYYKAQSLAPSAANGSEPAQQADAEDAQLRAKNILHFVRPPLGKPQRLEVARAKEMVSRAGARAAADGLTLSCDPLQAPVESGGAPSESPGTVARNGQPRLRLYISTRPVNFKYIMSPIKRLVVSRAKLRVSRHWVIPWRAKAAERIDLQRTEEIDDMLDAHAGKAEGLITRPLEAEEPVSNELGLLDAHTPKVEGTMTTALEAKEQRGARSPPGLSTTQQLRTAVASSRSEHVDRDYLDSLYAPPSRTSGAGALSLVHKSEAGGTGSTPARAYRDSTDMSRMSRPGAQQVSFGIPTRRSPAQLIWTRGFHTCVERNILVLLGGRRTYQTSSRILQQAETMAEASQHPPDIISMGVKKLENPHGIRAQLRKWQELHGQEDNLNDQIGFDPDPDTEDSGNNLTRLPDTSTAFRDTQAELEEEEHGAMAQFAQSSSEEPSSARVNDSYLKMGDLVEIEYVGVGRENIIAVYIRGQLHLAQFYTMRGRWLHMQEKKVQYSVPGWVSKDMIEPMLPYLPDPEDKETDLESLMEDQYLNDVSVPRHVAAPLVSRMVQFHAESQAIHRRHASALDNAHALLAHDTDLRYGSLVSASAKLLKMPADKVPVTALYAVRQAITHAGFAFAVDRRSHRLTGYLQIRSKEQVKMVNNVREWLREWQDDLAATATMGEQQLRKHRMSKGSQYVTSFVEKAKKIILRSREDRQVTDYGSIGPSKVKIPITPQQDSIRISKGDEFTAEDTELVRFMETWCLSKQFDHLPQLESLPPLLLQATGLYSEQGLRVSTGLCFLQELGTILPYENRVRFDHHLLLPSSQHSKPLQNLMGSLMEMANNHNMVDSMADLRHDWGKLPVYCIDGLAAQEIDDGLSVEPAATGPDGVKEWWVHVHIANPTAFFNRDHPLAKMARHMGETIYMPERTYMMLPRWSTQRHFSLAPDRPTLTFSAKLDLDARILEYKVTPGTVRNVIKLVPEEVAELLGVSHKKPPKLTLTVGGEPPPERARHSQVNKMSPAMVDDLRVLRKLAEKRDHIRRAAGGIFFDSFVADVKVWQSYKSTGLAWDHPYRRGSRRVEGDPVIEMKTSGLQNYFSPESDMVNSTVREMMLLACEVGAKWCEARQVPAIFRGSVARGGRTDSDKFYKEVLTPACDADGRYPMHLGFRYLETFGATAMSTTPFPHKILGMDAYGKVTSPLRRYGDMVVHWQIEAALRQEAATGRSLITPDKTADRSFLPFSAAVLDTIMVGLKPRETLIMRSKQLAETFWNSMLLFRAHHFSEPLAAGQSLPFGADGKTVHAYLHSPVPPAPYKPGCIVKELNFSAAITRPEGAGLIGPGGVPITSMRQADVWECEISNVDVFRRSMFLTPRRLVERLT